MTIYFTFLCFHVTDGSRVSRSHFVQVLQTRKYNFFFISFFFFHMICTNFKGGGVNTCILTSLRVILVIACPFSNRTRTGRQFFCANRQ